jgi:CheY-like chemotaxis protein
MPDHRQHIEMLLVEDNPQDLELAQRALRKAGLRDRTHIARDGTEALDFIFGEGSFAGRGVARDLKVILLDLKLPKIDGLEVLRRIKGDPRTKVIPVLVLTSSNERRDVADAYQLGVNSYIVKPVTFEHYTEVVRDAGLYWLRLNQPSTVEESS